MAIFNYNVERPFRSNPDLHLHYWGQEHCASGHSVGPGVRDIYKIHFIHAGTGTVTASEETHTLQAGQAFLTYPHIVTSYAADVADPWVYSWIAFTGEQVESILLRTSLSPGHPVFPMDEQYMPFLYERLTEAAANAEGLDLPLKSILYDFFARMLRTMPAARMCCLCRVKKASTSNNASTSCMRTIVRISQSR
ncbi:AraC family ligand binding domain-containing protein [Paenibacillus donghaensis]|uniref:AraC family ligand binding domain-containing protein n=1 Tax=Paenibacillus donghaensis TaxID=414771 RepID=UPI001FE34595|nr:AraC family ligand binding domain-containing protein [Paenibacillus donghaensis]